MTDIVERLREKAQFFRGSCEWPATTDALAEAADEIEALQAALAVHAGYAAEVEKQRDEIERLREALLALSRPDGFARVTDAQDRQARIDYARRVLGERLP